MRILRRTSVPTLLLIFLCLCGCVRQSAGDYLSYQYSEIIVDLEFSIDSAKYAASVTLKAASPGLLSGRDMSICFSSPESLRGITVNRREGADYISFGDIIIPGCGNSLSRMLDICRLFCIDGADLVSFETSALGVIKVNVIGLCENNNSYKIYIGSDDGLPRRIEALLDGKTIYANIMKMELSDNIQGNSKTGDVLE